MRIRLSRLFSFLLRSATFERWNNLVCEFVTSSQNTFLCICTNEFTQRFTENVCNTKKYISPLDNYNTYATTKVSKVMYVCYSEILYQIKITSGTCFLVYYQCNLEMLLAPNIHTKDIDAFLY